MKTASPILESIDQQIYDQLRTLAELALAEDLGAVGDVTSAVTLPQGKTITGRITAKASGVIAGLVAVNIVYGHIDPTLNIAFFVRDGDHVEPGTIICEVSGDACAVLAGERTALNFLQRLSGIATQTRRYVDAVAGTHTVILDTRKTTPGWRIVEKYAVRLGGAENHRMGLHDMVLIKDNHIDAAGGISAAIRAAQSNPLSAGLPIVVEVKDEAELREALSFDVTRILLDNMSAEAMRRAVEIAAGRVPLEASGGISLETLRAIAETGVNYISVGALTHSAPAFDLSMRLIEPE